MFVHKLFQKPEKNNCSLSKCRLARPEFILPEHRPEEPDQFPGDRHVGFTRHLAAIDKIPVPSSKPPAGAVGNVNGPLRLPGTALPQRTADLI